MTIDLDSGTGLFDRLGALGQLLDTINDRMAGTSSNRFAGELNDYIAKYDAETDNDIRAAVNGILDQFDSFLNSATAFRNALRVSAQTVLIEMAHADNPLAEKTVAAALEELIAQMEAGSEDVDASTAAVTVSAGGSNVGTAQLVASVVSGKGRNLENALAEDLVLDISVASTAGAERGTMRGEANESADKMDHEFPSGSGASKNIVVRNPSSDGFLTNGDFENFTTNDPDDWTIDTGVAGTDIKEDTTDHYRGSACLEYDGDGATLSAISQNLSSAALKSRTPYVVCVRTKVDVVPAAGTLIIDLYDGSSVINDDEGNANSLSIDVTSEATSYAAHTAAFRLPEPVPATVHIRVRLSAAVSSGSSLFIDDLIFGPAMTQMYTGGPYVALVRGDTDVAVDDRFTAAVTNTRDGKFQELFDKLFQRPDLLLPSDTGGTETIQDSLIA